MTDVLLFEELDVSCEQSALAQIEDMVELLDCKLTQISVEGRISRADASALVERYAVQFDERYPLSSFTQSRSATNLTIAQEGIMTSTGQYFIDLIKKASEILVKVFRWIIGLITFRQYRDKRAAAKAHNVKVVSTATSELKEAGIATPTTTPALEACLARYQSAYNGLAHAMITSGQPMQLLRELQEPVQQIESTVKLRIEHLKHLLTILPTSEAEDAAFEANAKSLLQSGVGEEIIHVLKKFPTVVPAGVTSPKRLLTLGVDWLTQLSLEEMETPDIAIVQASIASNRHNILNPVMVINPEMVRAMNDNIGELMKLRITSELRCTLRGRQVIHALVKTAVDEALGVQAYLNAVNVFSAARDTLLDAVWGYVTELYETAYGLGMSEVDVDKRRAAQRITDRMKSDLK